MNITRLRVDGPPETLDRLTPEQLCCGTKAPDRGEIARLAIDAMAEPAGMPPLSRCLTPDDHVAIPVAPGTPSAGPVAAGLIAALAAAGVARERIAIVVADAREAELISDELSDDIAAGVAVRTHHPDDGEELCFAGVTRTERPLLLNRTVFEADLVLPLGGDELRGPFAGLYPDFFDRPTIDRVATPAESDPTDRFDQGEADTNLDEDAEESPVFDPGASGVSEADEAGWMVGAPLLTRVVPGPGGGVAAVVTASAERVGDEARGASDRAWATERVEPADLVVAIVGGDATQQSWDAVCRALASAERLVSDEGAIALWTDLADEPNALLRRLADGEDRDELAYELGDAGEGAEQRIAAEVIRALDRGPVFLRSELDPSLVEDLGFAPVTSLEEMQRLVERFGGCTLVEEAQHVRLVGVAERADA